MKRIVTITSIAIFSVLALFGESFFSGICCIVLGLLFLMADILATQAPIQTTLGTVIAQQDNRYQVEFDDIDGVRQRLVIIIPNTFIVDSRWPQLEIQYKKIRLFRRDFLISVDHNEDKWAIPLDGLEIIVGVIFLFI